MRKEKCYKCYKNESSDSLSLATAFTQIVSTDVNKNKGVAGLLVCSFGCLLLCLSIHIWYRRQLPYYLSKSPNNNIKMLECCVLPRGLPSVQSVSPDSHQVWLLVGIWSWWTPWRLSRPRAWTTSCSFYLSEYLAVSLSPWKRTLTAIFRTMEHGFSYDRMHQKQCWL